MNERRHTLNLALAATATLLGGAQAASLPATGGGSLLPESAMAQTAPMLTAESWIAGSTALVPVVATDAQADSISAVESPSDGGASAGKPIDDLQFVRQASESGRQEVQSAREALPQLKNPGLKEIAGMLAADHGDANAKLAQLAQSKGWPLPAPKSPSAPPAGTSASDFDAKWTAEMIAGHEKSVALYRAQATGGEDRELRQYAHDTLPTIERHLAQLRSLQK